MTGPRLSYSLPQRYTMPIEHLLVITPTPAPVQPVRKGWDPYGAVQIQDLPGVDSVWVYGRMSSAPAQPVTPEQAATSRRLFSGVWKPTSQEELVNDLRAAFAPCEIEATAT